MNNLQSDKKSTFQVRIDKGWWKILTLLRIDTGESLKGLVEHALSQSYGIGKDGKPFKLK